MNLNAFLLVDVGNSRMKWATALSRGPIRVAGEIATKAASSTRIAALARKYPSHVAVLACVYELGDARLGREEEDDVVERERGHEVEQEPGLEVMDGDPPRL